MDDSTLQPHDLDAERALLGSLLINPAGIEEVIPLITPAVFYRHTHGLIFGVMLDLYRDDMAADYVTVCNRLRNAGTIDECGGEDAVFQLAMATATPFHAMYYATIVNAMARRRKIIRVATDLAAGSYKTDEPIGPVVEVALGRLESTALRVENGDALTALEDVEPEEPAFLVDPLVLRDDVTLLSGPGSAGKTRLVLSLLGAIERGGYVLGHPDLECDATGRGVLITGGEERIQTLAWMDRTVRADVVEITRAFTDAEGKLTAYAHWHLRRLVRRETPLIILDSISNLYLGNENDRRHVNTFIKELRQYAYQGVAIVIIGHVSRSHADWSGSTAWQTGVRSHVTLTRDEDDPDIRILTLVKANRALAGQTWRVTDRDTAGNWIPWRMADSEMVQNGDTEPDHVETLLKVLVQDLGVPRAGAPKPISQAAIAKAMRLRKGDVARLLDSAQSTGRLVAFDGAKNGKEYLVP